ncbi:E3 ubiquitin-protein ligase synoviolin isoform X2 [Neocloeon triangulifer]|uniref:E3 ubiquitin-protein ligase synoviolin isoform X2 n=1 Tax=Neocloeon triangulifer TaxID=2078957 RepID=UPI00286EC356|nr:E3 ubiquitin-protein ligase synoviolin isoform X2 [Neocloeon triangulifer]
MRAAGVTLLSITLTAAVIGNAFYQKKQFYPSVVYITKSNPCMAVMYIQAFVMVILMGKLMRKVFFGQLRAAEFEHLMERSWYAVTETCLAFTVFRDDFSPKFVALFTVLLFLKSFHWLAEDRVDFMERSPVISWLFHIRVISLLSVLGYLDYLFVGHAYQSTVTKGASVQLVFGFEYAILLTIICNIGIKYVLHAVDLQSDNPWENKAVFLLYTELAMGFVKVVLYVTFVAIMVRIYTLPLFAFRPMYYTMRAFNKAFNDVILSRRAIRNMNTLYPDATPEELSAADNVCIICREEMVTASKKLPCNHIFHTSCLRSWFQRQQTCPTCRLNILQTPPVAPHQQQQQQANNNAAAAPPPGAPAAAPGALPPPMNPFVMMAAAAAAAGNNMWPPPPFPVPPPPQQQPPPTAGPSTSQAAGGQAPSAGNPLMYLRFPMLPFMVPPPVPPRDLGGLSEEELRRLEGVTREAVEARIHALRQVALLLDCASLMATQVAAATPPNYPPTAPASPASGEASAPEAEQTEAAPATPATPTSPPSTSADQTTSSATEPSSEQEEVRRRRLQRFSAPPDANDSN